MPVFSFLQSSSFLPEPEKIFSSLSSSVWNDMQVRMFSAIATKPVVVARDGQIDSPGFSAKNCTYTLMHAHLDYVLHVELVDVRNSQLQSSVMEKVGCGRALDFVMKKLVIEELVTDASSQLIKMLGKY